MTTPPPRATVQHYEKRTISACRCPEVDLPESSSCVSHHRFLPSVTKPFETPLKETKTTTFFCFVSRVGAARAPSRTGRIMLRPVTYYPLRVITRTYTLHLPPTIYLIVAVTVSSLSIVIPLNTQEGSYCRYRLLTSSYGDGSLDL